MADGPLVELHDPTGLPAGFRFLPTDEEILEYLAAKVTGKLDPSIDKYISTLKEENGICYTHPERLPGVRKDGPIRYFFHRPSKAYSTGTRKRRRVHTDEDGRETRWQERGNTQPVSIGGTVKGFKKILVFDAQYECHQYHLGNNEEKEGELVVSKVFYLTQLQHHRSSIKNSIGRKTRASFIKVLNVIKGSLSTTSNTVAKVISFCNGSELQASGLELPHGPNDANNDSGSGFCDSVANESIPKRRKPSQSKSDDWEVSSLSTIRTLDHSPTPNQTETGGTKRQGMQAQISINSSAADMKNAGSRLDMVPPSSLPPAQVQAWGSASYTSLPKLAQPVPFGHMNSASSLGSGNQAGSSLQMGLPASASCWPNVQQPLGSGLTDDQNAAPRGSNFTGNQNAASRPVVQNQNSFWGRVPVNPDIAVGAHAGNQNATPRPVNLNQEPDYRRGGIGCITMNPSVNIRSAGSSTISINNGLTNNVSAPPCWANYGRGS